MLPTAAMDHDARVAQILLVDDASALADLFATAIHDRLGHDVSVLVSLRDVGDELERLARVDLAIVDLSFPQEDGSGLDALAEIFQASPSTTLAIITQGDEWVAQLLRDAWELLPIATVISKSAPLMYQLAAIEQVITVGSAEIDPAIQPLLPAHRPAYRTPARFGSLVQHQGHAKLWVALMQTKTPTYRTIADAAGLKLNTIKNYRAQLLPELSIHGMIDPSLKEMGEFAIRCRAFLAPFLEPPTR